MVTVFGKLSFFTFLAVQVGGHLFRYLVIAGGSYGLFWKALKEKFQGRRVQGSAIKKNQIQTEILYSMSTITCFAVVGSSIYFANKLGWTKIYYNVADHGWGYWWVSLFAILFFHDTYFYFMHRMMHHPVLYRHVHKVHHDSISPTPFTSLSFHPFEAFLEALVIPFLILVVPLHIGVLLAYQFVTFTLNVNGHLGYELYPSDRDSRPVLKWINTATLHALHHSRYVYNYGLYTTFWDRLLGTLRLSNNVGAKQA